MKITLLIIFYLIVNTYCSKDLLKQRKLVFIQTNEELKLCLECSGEFSSKLIEQIDFIDLKQESILTEKQMSILKECYNSFGSGQRPSSSSITPEDITIKTCIDFNGSELQISTDSIRNAYNNCANKNICIFWINKIQSLYADCAFDLDACEDDYSLPYLVKQCFDINQDCKSHFNI